MSFLRPTFWALIALSHAGFLARPLIGPGELSWGSALALVVTIVVALLEAWGRGPTRLLRLPSTPRAWGAMVLLLVLVHAHAIERAWHDAHGAASPAVAVVAVGTIVLAVGPLMRRAWPWRGATSRRRTVADAVVRCLLAAREVARRVSAEVVWVRERLALAPPVA